jgi:hypothetical protein
MLSQDELSPEQRQVTAIGFIVIMSFVLFALQLQLNLPQDKFARLQLAGT